MEGSTAQRWTIFSEPSPAITPPPSTPVHCLLHNDYNGVPLYISISRLGLSGNRRAIHFTHTCPASYSLQFLPLTDRQFYLAFLADDIREYSYQATTLATDQPTYGVINCGIDNRGVYKLAPVSK